MTDDTLAALLADAPPAPDPAFRYDVLLEVARRTQRRTALRRALRNTAVFLALGLMAAGLAAMGDRLWPLSMTIGVGAGAAALALLLIEGPRGFAARSVSAFRLPV